MKLVTFTEVQRIANTMRGPTHILIRGNSFNVEYTQVTDVQLYKKTITVCYLQIVCLCLLIKKNYTGFVLDLLNLHTECNSTDLE